MVRGLLRVGGMRPTAAVFLATLAITAVPAEARAEAAPGATAAPASALSLELDGHLGWTDGEQAGGMTVGVAGRALLHGLTAGVSLQGATALLSSLGSASLLAGLAIPDGWMRGAVPIDWLRIHLLGELGYDAFGGVHRGLLDDDPGTGGVLAFAGLRGALLVRVHRSTRGHALFVGLTTSYAEDLGTLDKTYSWRDTGTNWFSGEPYDELRTTTVVLGQSRLALLATATVAFAPP